MVERRPSRTSGRAEETRRRLLDAGRAAFAQKSLSSVHLKHDVLDPAGVSVGSFYHQFKDKRELFVAVLEQQSQALRARFSEIHRSDPERPVERVAQESYSLVFELADRFTDAMRIQLREGDASDPWTQRFVEQNRMLWQRSLTEDYSRIASARGLDLEVELAAELVQVLTEGVLRHYLALPLADRPKARERLIDGLVRLTLSGLSGLTRQATKTKH